MALGGNALLSLLLSEVASISLGSSVSYLSYGCIVFIVLTTTLALEEEKSGEKEQILSQMPTVGHKAVLDPSTTFYNSLELTSED